MEEEVAREEVEIDKDLQRKIEKTVKKILKKSNLYKMTEIKAREQASVELDLDLSQDPYKVIVREVVENFIEEAIKVVGNKIAKLPTKKESRVSI
ncbi:PREDICTED: mediator-associated protein 3 [Camelina sativa]|uniref:Mediator-associated protein 3 n=1 Tax=Camelina sativa TaxID=90675 RepID=A0ABM0UHV7_CAMSA|nr:PREDICTED: mediator-associated protein 3 [Camelina sativa]